MIETPEPKPCPICRAAAKLHVESVTTGHGSSDPAYQVICTGCGIRTRRIVTAMDTDPAAKGRMLVEEWNNRQHAAPLDPISLLATLVASAAAEKDHPRFIAGYMAGLTDARLVRQDARSLANVDVFDRRKAMGKPESEPVEYQADIITIEGRDHHGIGTTPAEALLNAARHWYKHSET